MLSAVGWIALLAQILATLLIVPDWTPRLEPVYLASLGALLTSAVILGLRVRRSHGTLFERRLLAAFLGGMPLVYVASWALGPHGTEWLALELVGVVVFVGLALAGLRGSVWFLAGGIIAHGLLWDLAHHGRTPFIPDWYTLGCLLVDVGLGVHVATEIPRFARRSDVPSR